MPSWAPAIISETFSIARSVVRAARLPACGARLDLGAARGDQRELGADEERVGGQQDGADGDARGRCSCRAPPSGAVLEPDAVDAQLVHRQHGQRDLVRDAVLVVGAQR